MNHKETSVIIALIIFVVGIFLLGTFGAGGSFTDENGFYQTESAININRIKAEMNDMSVQEIEEAISEINKEIERLKLQID